MKKKPHLRLKCWKRWSPFKGFKGIFISEESTRSFYDQLQVESWAEWACKPAAPFEVIPPMPSQRYKPTAMRAFISSITP